MLPKGSITIINITQTIPRVYEDPGMINYLEMIFFNKVKPHQFWLCGIKLRAPENYFHFMPLNRLFNQLDIMQSYSY